MKIIKDVQVIFTEEENSILEETRKIISHITDHINCEGKDCSFCPFDLFCSPYSNMAKQINTILRERND